MSSIQLSETLSLRTISSDNAVELKQLMHRIYPPAYEHLWEDDGYWYVEETFSSENLEKELANPKASYYFVTYQQEIIGILRLIHDLTLSDLPEKKATKLHRIYLDPKIHGKAIGKFLMEWVTQQAVNNGSEILWLEAMDTQEQALQFYKKLGYITSNDFRLTFELLHSNLRGMHTMYLPLS